jgi:hypothetical protein
VSLQKEGSMVFWLRHAHDDWSTNAHRYNFGTVEAQGVIVNAIKHPDGTLECAVDGALGRRQVFRVAIPSCDEQGLFVALTWELPLLRLYLNGTLIETKTL